MMRSRSAVQGFLVGAVCTILCTACGGTSPIGPGGVGATRSRNLTPTSVPSSRGQLSNDLATLGGPAAEGRFLVCELGDGSRTQLSLLVWGMPDAVLHCLRSMNGRVHGIVSAPAPSIP